MEADKKYRLNLRTLDYQPNTSPHLDIEIFPASDLKRRRAHPHQPIVMANRYSFHMLLYVEQGCCTQWVDFQSVYCEAGSLLTLQPGQAHSFGRDENWEGWVLLFRPEFLLESSIPAHGQAYPIATESLPSHAKLGTSEQCSVQHSIIQMRQDSLIDAALANIHSLLRYQLHALLTRLRLLHHQSPPHAPANTRALQCFKKFQHSVEQNFGRWHKIAEYAHDLGHSEKSLTRATLLHAGITAKAFIASRITLEAKRLLVHTNLPIAVIGEKLGFEEATNFIKFFKRESECTPAEFRKRQLNDHPFADREGPSNIIE